MEHSHGRGARVAIWVVGAAVLAVVTLAASAASVRLRPIGAVTFGSGAEVATLPQFGDGGSHVLNYIHGQTVTLSFPLTNTGRLPLTVTAVRLGGGALSLLEPERVVVGVDPLPARLGAGESAAITVTAPGQLPLLP